MNMQLKNTIDSVYNYCNKLDAHDLGVSRGNEDEDKLSTTDCFRIEMTDFILYLSASDGVVTGAEAAFIRDYLGYDISVNKCVEIINEDNLYSREFEQKVPLILRVMVDVDNRLRSGNPVSETLITIYEIMGRELVYSDGDCDAQEIEDLNIYINMLRNYVRSNLDLRKYESQFVGRKK